jgi:LAS superfamily LD-carboxypeptidase LdcB
VRNYLFGAILIGLPVAGFVVLPDLPARWLSATVDFAAVKRWQVMGGSGPHKAGLNEEYYELLCPKQRVYSLDLSLEPVTKLRGLPPEYVPTDLQELKKVRTIGIQCVTSATAAALSQLFEAAAQEGVQLAVTSGYRRPEIQQLTRDYWIAAEGEKAAHEVAEPYHSEHQTGTAVDLTGGSVGFRGVQDSFGDTPEGKWLQANAHRFGFTLSYPASTTEYVYEPWHFRFVGASIAAMLHEKGVSFNEYFVEKTVSERGVERILYNNPTLF